MDCEEVLTFVEQSEVAGNIEVLKEDGGRIAMTRAGTGISVWCAAEILASNFATIEVRDITVIIAEA